jgi:hypothetical protein
MKNLKGAALASAVVGIAFLTACSDSPIAPTAAAVSKANFAVGDVSDFPPAPDVVLGKIVVCKAGNAAGAFDLATSPVVANVDGAPVASTISVTNGTCKTVSEDLGLVDGTGSRVVITEQPADNTVETLTSCKFRGAGDATESDCSLTETTPRFINGFHGYVITYTNTFTEPPPPPADVCDFSTFGGFVLLPNNISYGGNAGFASSGFAYGSLNFVNHTTGDHIHVWNVTDYGHPATGPLSQYDDSRLAFGLGSVNDGPINVPVEWRFVDLGEPAKKKGDAVYLNVGGVTLIPEQVVQGGNIQLHAKCKKAPKAEKH